MVDKPPVDDDDDDETIVCQGPPRCMLKGVDAEDAMLAGCIWCSKIYIDRSGKRTVIEPGEC